MPATHHSPLIALLKSPATAAVLQSCAATSYLDQKDAVAHRVARWHAVACTYSDAAVELLEKTAFRRRKDGMLEAERDRLDGLFDRSAGRYATDPDVDRRMRDLRGRLARLATLNEALDQPIPHSGPELDEMIHALCGPNGWYQNMPLPDGRESFDFGHVKPNSPSVGRDHNAFQLDLLRPHLPRLEGATVADVGAADGYFGLTAAREGADALLIEPDPVNCLRIRFFARLYGLQGKVRLANTFLSGRHVEMLRRTDLCIASGLLYHLWPLRGSLDLLLQAGGKLVLEYLYEDRDLAAAGEADAEWQPRSPIPDRWLQRYLAEAGWSVREFPDWEAKLLRANPHGERRKMILCERIAARQ